MWFCSTTRDTFGGFKIPTEVKLRKNTGELEITWPDKKFVFPAELLRVESPSVEVQGVLEGQRKVMHVVGFVLMYLGSRRKKECKNISSCSSRLLCD
jgi:hypothetical protein